MHANERPPTAKIYQFPRKTAASSGQAVRDPRAAADHRLRALPSVEFGSGWYHEAAVQAEWPRKS
jgi:hypothetical protein